MAFKLTSLDQSVHDKTSDLLKAALDALNHKSTTAGELMRSLGQRSFGGILILFAVLGLVPGISIVTGFVIFILGIQLVCGFDAPRLPRKLMDKKLETRVTRKVLTKCIGYVEYIERWVHPQWIVLTQPAFTRALGFIVLALGLIVMLPLPFSNMPPAIAVILMATGQLERDGRLVLIGAVLSIGAFAFGLFFANFAIEHLSQLFN